MLRRLASELGLGRFFKTAAATRVELTPLPDNCPNSGAPLRWNLDSVKDGFAAECGCGAEHFFARTSVRTENLIIGEDGAVVFGDASNNLQVGVGNVISVAPDVAGGVVVSGNRQVGSGNVIKIG